MLCGRSIRRVVWETASIVIVGGLRVAVSIDGTRAPIDSDLAIGFGNICRHGLLLREALLGLPSIVLGLVSYTGRSRHAVWRIAAHCLLVKSVQLESIPVLLQHLSMYDFVCCVVLCCNMPSNENMNKMVPSEKGTQFRNRDSSLSVFLSLSLSLPLSFTHRRSTAGLPVLHKVRLAAKR